MMKNLLLILAVFVTCKTAFAQKELVTLDEHNKYIYYHVDETPALKADTLYQRCLAGLKTSKFFGKIKPTATPSSAIKIKSKLMLYTSLTVAKHEAGELAYTLQIEFKDGKYRYWLSDFIFSVYERNRYAVYVKAPGDGIPLEQVKAKYDSRTLDSYLDQIAKNGKAIGEEMTSFITNPTKKAAPPEKIDTRKW